MLFAALALYAQSIELSDLSVEQRRFLDASNGFPQAAARCKAYVRPDFRDRAERQVDRETDPFLSAVMVEGLRRYDDIASIRATLPPLEEGVCSSELSKAILEVAAAHSALIQSRTTPRNEN